VYSSGQWAEMLSVVLVNVKSCHQNFMQLIAIVWYHRSLPDSQKVRHC
jgi:hypothetical protein